MWLKRQAESGLDGSHVHELELRLAKIDDRCLSIVAKAFQVSFGTIAYHRGKATGECKGWRAIFLGGGGSTGLHLKAFTQHVNSDGVVLTIKMYQMTG